MQKTRPATSLYTFYSAFAAANALCTIPLLDLLLCCVTSRREQKQYSVWRKKSIKYYSSLCFDYCLSRAILKRDLLILGNFNFILVDLKTIVLHYISSFVCYSLSNALHKINYYFHVSLHIEPLLRRKEIEKNILQWTFSVSLLIFPQSNWASTIFGLIYKGLKTRFMFNSRQDFKKIFWKEVINFKHRYRKIKNLFI